MVYARGGEARRRTSEFFFFYDKNPQKETQHEGWTEGGNVTRIVLTGAFIDVLRKSVSKMIFGRIVVGVIMRWPLSTLQTDDCLSIKYRSLFRLQLSSKYPEIWIDRPRDCLESLRSSTLNAYQFFLSWCVVLNPYTILHSYAIMPVVACRVMGVQCKTLLFSYYRVENQLLVSKFDLNVR